MIFSMLFFLSFILVNAQPIGAFDLFLVDVKTGDVEQLTYIDDADIYNPSFSNNGKYIVADGVSEFGQGIGIADVQTGDAWPLYGGDGGNDASWSPNGELIVFDGWFFSDYMPVYGLQLLPPEGGIPSLIRPWAHDAEWAQDSEWLVFNDGSGEVRSLNIYTSEENLVVPFGINPTWSPNGNWIAYSDGNNLFKIAVDYDGTPLGPPVQLTDDGLEVYNAQPSWSNNSQTIVFHSNLGNTDFDWNIWTISADGSDPTLLVEMLGSQEFDPCFSKNGQWVVFSSDAGYEPNGEDMVSITMDGTVSLEQNFPNPFTEETIIQFYLPATAEVDIQVFNAQGALVNTLASEKFAKGKNSVKWNGASEDGAALPNGLYTYRLVIGDQMISKRMILMR